jgi:UDP-glucose 4-epimerase
MPKKSTGMNILVTGGAGYVGSIVAELLLERGNSVVVIDDLRMGHRDGVPSGARLVVGDINNGKALDAVFGSEKIDAVVHMAAESLVGVSMRDPLECMENNVGGGMNLLNHMLKHNVSKIVFSSSAAVYGEPRRIPINEKHPKEPVNTYGESKIMFERILFWYGKAYGIKHISLRYFNAAGASEMFGEDHRPETHLVPNVLNAAVNKKSSVDIYGYDYDTPDGTCVRDYVHVVDIAQAHVLALQKIGKLSGNAYNLGSGHGNSVLEVIEVSRQVTGVDIAVTLRERRAGDPAVLVASCGMAKKELGWRPKFTKIEDIIDSAWRWKSQHPKGYKK